MGRWYVCIICFFIFYGCGGSPSDEPWDVNGRWSVVMAYRNDQPTTTLEDAFFDIRGDSTITTNILRRERTYTLRREETTLHQYSQPPMDYVITSHDRDSMVLTTSISSYDFVFHLHRDTAYTTTD